MSGETFDGSDHARHRAEVEERWGPDAWAAGDTWWRAKSDDERTAWKAAAARLAREWALAATQGHDPASEFAQDLAHRHVEWLTGIPGTPAHGARVGDERLRAYVTGLGDLYAADDRFAARYGGEGGAVFVRDALHAWAARHL